MKLVELKGYKALRALNAFHTLMLGLKMLPAYITEPYDEFYESFKDKTESQKEKLVREAALFVQLQKDEVEALASFACDQNGVPYSSVNMANLGPVEILEIIVSVCMEIGRINVDLLTEDEKKKFRSTAST